MLIFLTIVQKIVNPYWNTFRKHISKRGISSITVTYVPTPIGHSIGIIILLLLGIFTLPQKSEFYLFWFIMISIASIVNVWKIWGLLRTKFFAVETIGSLGFVSTAGFAFLILGEKVSFLQTLAICIAVVGVIIFSWPRKTDGKFTIDRGILYLILSVILSGLAAVFYKLATSFVPDYPSFLSGRFVGDLMGWTTVWLIGMFIIKRNPIRDLLDCLHGREGLFLTIGVTISTLLESWLIFKLPVSTIAMIGILAFPSSYLISRFKYEEKISFQMWAGTILIIYSVVLFLTS